MSLDDRTGAVDLVQKVSVPGAVMPLAVSPSRRFLYASLRSAPFSVSTLAIEKGAERDRKSTRLNSSHRCISYAVFCLKKKKKKTKKHKKRNNRKKRDMTIVD